MAERTKVRNIWFLSPLFPSKREETKTKYSAPKAPLFSKTVFTGHGSGSNPVAAKIRYLLLFKEFHSGLTKQTLCGIESAELKEKVQASL